MSPAVVKDFQVAIVGAGLGGLVLALLIQKECPQLKLTIYESAHELAEIGAGVAAWPRVWEVLTYLGLEEDLLEAAGAKDNSGMPMYVRKGDEERMHNIGHLTPTIRTFHRAQLQQILFKHLRNADKIIQFNKRLATYCEPKSDDDPIVLQFKDGSSCSCDLLIGSDGIRSVVRKTMYNALADEAKGERAQELRSMIDPVWSGTVAYRGLIPANKLWNNMLEKASKPSIITGKWKHLTVYPVSRGELINVVGFVSTPGGEGSTYEGKWHTTATTDELLKRYEEWGPELKSFLKLIDKPTLWAVNTVKPLPTYVRGRVALIGDAAHAMTPHQGSGAGQAMEDGFIIASLLAHPSTTRAKLASALKAFDEVRRPFSQSIQELSRRTGHLHDLLCNGWEDISVEESTSGKYPPQLRQTLLEKYDADTSWAAETTSIIDDRDRAYKLLQGKSIQ